MWIDNPRCVLHNKHLYVSRQTRIVKKWLSEENQASEQNGTSQPHVAPPSAEINPLHWQQQCDVHNQNATMSLPSHELHPKPSCIFHRFSGTTHHGSIYMHRNQGDGTHSTQPAFNEDGRPRDIHTFLFSLLLLLPSLIFHALCTFKCYIG